MGTKGVEVLKVVRCQGAVSHDRGCRNHGVHSQSTGFLQDAKAFRRKYCFFVAEGQNTSAHQRHCDGLLLWSASAQELVPGHRCDAKGFTRNKPLFHPLRLVRLRNQSPNQVVGVQADHAPVRHALRPSSTSDIHAVARWTSTPPFAWKASSRARGSVARASTTCSACSTERRTTSACETFQTEARRFKRRAVGSSRAKVVRCVIVCIPSLHTILFLIYKSQFPTMRRRGWRTVVMDCLGITSGEAGRRRASGGADPRRVQGPPRGRAGRSGPATASRV